MPNLNDDQNADLDGEEDDDLDPEANDQDDDSPDDSDSEDEEDAEPKGDAKRIADLQSKADKAEARANKAENALKALRGEGGTETDPATKALMLELREASLDAVYGEFPDLKEYGIQRDLIEGTTRAEMRVNARQLVSLIKNVSTKARNRALADAGVQAEPQGSKRRPPVDYGSMDEETFQKELRRLTGR